jgi:predicted transcriptional regulator
MAKNDTPKPTPAELEVLFVLWQHGPATVKEVLAARLPERPDLAYATVLRSMQVMHSKGLLTRDESQHSHVYAAAFAQQALQRNLLGDVIAKLFGGSGKKLVLAALSEHVSKRERAEIQRYLKEHSDE